MSKKHVLYSGFMLFSLFFGAGNLIFPPSLGMASGNYYVPAIAGFILTAVFLPFLTIISVSLSDNGLISIGQRVHPVFGLAFAIVIYMSIGAFYGIPRASNVANELGLMQVYHVEGPLPLLLFSVPFRCIRIRMHRLLESSKPLLFLKDFWKAISRWMLSQPLLLELSWKKLKEPFFMKPSRKDLFRMTQWPLIPRFHTL